jgi:hypothetical protein
MKPGHGRRHFALATLVFFGFLGNLADKTTGGLGNRDFEIEVPIERQGSERDDKRPEDDALRPGLSGKFRSGKHHGFCIRKEISHVNMVMAPGSGAGGWFPRDESLPPEAFASPARGI